MGATDIPMMLAKALRPKKRREEEDRRNTLKKLSYCTG